MGTDELRDFYAMLGVPPHATSKEIRHAYRELARRYHPDSREVHTPTSLFHLVQEAYAVLRDPASRQAYDRRRQELRSREPKLTCGVLLSREVLYTGHEEQVFYALLDVHPAPVRAEERQPLDLCIVIDRSTSMKGARLRSTREAARRIVDQLGDDDCLGIVSFSDRAEVVVSGRVGSHRPQLKAGITGVQAEGGTEIFQGLRVGLRELMSCRREDAVGYLILLTDGSTYGDEDLCLAAASKAGDSGVGIITMGIGEDWNDQLLDEIAARSGGTCVYIASSHQVQQQLVGIIRGLGLVLASELNLVVEASAGVRVESAFLTSPSLARLDHSATSIRLGSLRLDVPVRVLLEVVTAPRVPGAHRLLKLELEAVLSGPADRRESSTRGIVCTFTDDVPDQFNQSVPKAVLSALRRVTLFRLQEQAWSSLEKDDVDGATRRLEAVASGLLDLGEKQLARAVHLEAAHIAESGASTDRGRKEIKYGTRSLTIGGHAYD